MSARRRPPREGLSDADAGARPHMSEATVKTRVSRYPTELARGTRVRAGLPARDAGQEPSTG